MITVTTDTNHVTWKSVPYFEQEYRECCIKVLFIHVFYLFLFHSPCMHGYNQIKSARRIPLIKRKLPRY